MRGLVIGSDKDKRAQQRRNRRDGAQRIEETLQIMDDVPAAILEALHHNLARLIPIGKSDGQQLAQG